MNKKSKIFDKIKKCMALAASANEHEAAAALRQAQKLMKEHDISDADVLAAQVSEARARARGVSRPADWEACLAYKVAEAFGCFLIHSRTGYRAASWLFVGCGSSPEVAQYVFIVLRRQALKARKDFTDTALRRVKKNRTKRADMFCQGWVATALQSIARWQQNAEQKAAINAYLNRDKAELGELQTTRRAKYDDLSQKEQMDYWRGRAAGKSAEVNRGVGADDGPARLEQRQEMTVN